MYISAEVQEQVYETLRKNTSGYENTKEMQRMHYPMSSSTNSSAMHHANPETFKNSSTGPSLSSQSKIQADGRSAATGIVGISGFASPRNIRKLTAQGQENHTDSANSSKNDAMALYARVDRTKKKKNRDSGEGSR